jgi:hypothetical protein
MEQQTYLKKYFRKIRRRIAPKSPDLLKKHGLENKRVIMMAAFEDKVHRIIDDTLGCSSSIKVLSRAA